VIDSYGTLNITPVKSFILQALALDVIKLFSTFTHSGEK